MKRILIFIFLLMAVVVFADEGEATPEVTPEVTAEVTPESTPEETVSCPNLVQDALELTALNCDATDTNEACYGFIDINAETRANTITFTNPGDIVDVLDLQGVQLSPMDLSNGLWGLMVMDVEANTTDGSTAVDNVQVVLFGDTELRDASRFVQVTADEDLTIFEKPREDSEPIFELAKDDTIIVNSQLEDASWLRVRFNAEESGESLIGWLEADKVTAASDLEVVQMMTAEEAEEPPDDLSVKYGPMQAFVFESGRDDAPCEEAPNSGMLIQTPDGEASVSFVMDEVIVTMNGTGVISAQADGNLSLVVVDGEATVEANGVSSTAIAGQAIDVALDGDLNAVGEPSEARDATATEVQGLPTSLLDDPVTPTASNLPNEGTWRFVLDTPSPITCPDGTEVPFTTSGSTFTIQPQIDSLIIGGIRFNQVAEGAYSQSYSDASGTFIQVSLRANSSTSIVGDATMILATTDCTLSVDFHYEFVGN